LVRQSASRRCYSADEPTPRRADNMLHCFSLNPAESAGWIPIKQAHNIQVHVLWGSQLPFLVDAYFTLAGHRLFSYMVCL